MQAAVTFGPWNLTRRRRQGRRQLVGGKLGKLSKKRNSIVTLRDLVIVPPGKWAVFSLGDLALAFLRTLAIVSQGDLSIATLGVWVIVSLGEGSAVSLCLSD